MPFVAEALTVVVALLQGYFLVVEMFLWQTPRVRRAFGMSEEHARLTAVLAKNQGLYNGFLAAGLVWSVVMGGSLGYLLKLFFLGCVLIAGLYGAATANRKILYVQALPALLALLATMVAFLAR